MISIGGRLTVAGANQLGKSQSTDLDQTAEGAPIPIIYGLTPVVGRNAGYGLDGSGNLIVRVVWGAGEVGQIGDVWVNGAALHSSVQVNHYRGTLYQGVDPLMETIVGITYTDTMIMEKPYGRMGICYSVFLFPSGSITAPPTFQALIQGKLVYDPRLQNEYPDPFIDYTSWGLEFVGADASTPAKLSYETNDPTVSWNGTAQILSNELDLDGSGFCSVPGNTAVNQFGTGKWTLECRFTPGSIAAGTAAIITKGTLSPSICISVYRDAATVKVTMSSNGTTGDIAGALTIITGMSAGIEYDITIEFTGREYLFYGSGGVLVNRVVNSTPLFANTNNWQFGALGGGTYFVGTIATARFTKGVNRLGGNCAADTVPSRPWRESDTAPAGVAFSALTCLCVYDFIENQFYGMGARRSDTLNMVRAINWNEELVDSVQRANLALVIDSVDKTQSWLDLLCTYAECFWVWDADGRISLIPDRAVSAANPSGWAMGDNADFATDPTVEWTVGSKYTYDSANMWLSKAAGSTDAENKLFQPLTKTFEAGVTYVATISVAVFAGNVGLNLGGAVVIPLQNATGDIAVEFDATGFETGKDLQLVMDSAFVGLVLEVTIRRKYWLVDSVVANSLTTSGGSDSGVPTAISLHYRLGNFTANWPTLVYSGAKAPGVAEGIVPSIDTQWHMPGIFREAEAINKAITKLARVANRYSVTWITTDIGIALQRGTVVRVIDDSSGFNDLVLIESVKMVEMGRYRVTGSNYSDTHYPSEAVSADGYGLVPVGAILPMKSSTVPSGWARWTAADTKFIKGTTTSVGSTGGTASVTAPVLAVDAGNSNHMGEPSAGAFLTKGYLYRGGSMSGFFYSDNYPGQRAGGHSGHTVTIGSHSPDVFRTSRDFIIKTGTTSALIPAEALVMGLSGIVETLVYRFVTSVGRLLQADQSEGAGRERGSAWPDVLFQGSSSQAFSHDHWTRTSITDGAEFTSGSYQIVWHDADAIGASHSHIAVVAAAKRLQRAEVPFYWSPYDFRVAPGFIFGWAGSLSSLPADYSLCDGTLGTPDLHGYFISVAAKGNEFSVTAGSEIVYSGSLSNAGTHNHRGTERTGGPVDCVAVVHDGNQTHTHDIVEDSASWEPPYYTLAFIMYNPAVTVGFADIWLQISGGEADGTTTIVDDSLFGQVATVTGGSGTLEYTDAELFFAATTIRTDDHKIIYSGFVWPSVFTIEGFFNLDSVDAGNMSLFGNRTATEANSFGVYLDAANDRLSLIVGGVASKYGETFAGGDWIYVSVGYDGSDWYFHYGRVADGVARLPTAGGPLLPDVGNTMHNDLNIGGHGTTGNMNGYFTQIRVTSGAARNTNLTVAIPEGPFPTT